MAIELSKEDHREALASLEEFFRRELEIEIDDLRGRLILDYLLKELGPLAYNKGVADAQRYFLEKTEDLTGTCFEHPFTYWPTRKKG